MILRLMLMGEKERAGAGAGSRCPSAKQLLVSIKKSYQKGYSYEVVVHCRCEWKSDVGYGDGNTK